MTDLAQALLALIVRTAIPRDECLTICEPQVSFRDPYRDTLPCQPLLGVDVEALNTDKPIRIHGPQELHPAKEAPETLGVDGTPSHPSQHVHRRPSAISAILMRPVPRGMKRFNERRVYALHLLDRARLFELAVRQASLHLTLRLNKVLPGLAQLAVLRLDLSRLQNGHGIIGAAHRAMIGDDALRAPRGRQGRKEQLQECGQLVMFGGHPRQNRA